MKAYAIALTALLFSACAAPPQANQTEPASESTEYTPPPGSNEMLRAPITAADGLEVIISDVVIPPNAEVPRHYHPGEEFVYIIEGTAVHVEEGKADKIVEAGDALVIPPGAVHSPRGGAEGARAIVFRVHVEGEEERTLVE
jgi:quercetin dioxygenase-like cupin family protein